MTSFQNSFALDEDSPAYANLSGNIVSVLQAGCFFGAAASFWVSDRFGRKTALIFADIIFLIGSILQTCSGIGTRSLALLYVGRVIGGVGVGLVSAIVPTYVRKLRVRARCVSLVGCLTSSELPFCTGVSVGARLLRDTTKHLEAPSWTAVCLSSSRSARLAHRRGTDILAWRNLLTVQIGENVNKKIRGRCIGTMQLFK